MSIFSGWLKQSQSDIEKGLEELHSHTLSQLYGITLQQARDEVRKTIKLFNEEAIKNGTANLPDNYGDLIIRTAESGDLKAKNIVAKAHKEGVTDEDK